MNVPKLSPPSSCKLYLYCNALYTESTYLESEKTIGSKWKTEDIHILFMWIIIISVLLIVPSKTGRATPLYTHQHLL